LLFWAGKAQAVWAPVLVRVSFLPVWRQALRYEKEEKTDVVDWS
jgi:hypothetical protein